MGDAAVVVAIVVCAALFLAWIVTLFLLVVDSIAVGAKIAWFVALTLLAPITIPLYLVLRHRRHAARPRSAAGESRPQPL